MALLQQHQKGDWFYVDLDDGASIYDMEVEVVGCLLYCGLQSIAQRMVYV